MASPRQSPTRSLLAILLLRAPLAPTAIAAVHALPSTPVEELVELEEVRALGKLTANIVATAEDRVYRLYNRLNKANRYDVHCGDIPGNAGSRIMQRTCLPDFLRNYLPGFYSGSYTYSGSYIAPGRPCIGMTPYRDMNGEPYWMANCSSSNDGNYYASSYEPSPNTIPAEERTRFAGNVLRVIDSDPELREMAAGLARLYIEMDRIQAHYDKLREERRAARALAPRPAGNPGHPGK